MPERHWVMLGSASDPDQAEALRGRAMAALPDQVVVVPEDTADGRVYRVASGPYVRRPLAEQLLADARRAGFRDARLRSAPLPDGVARSRPATAGPVPEAVDADAGRYDAVGADAFVDRAPEGYQLHRLRPARDASQNGASADGASGDG